MKGTNMAIKQMVREQIELRAKQEDNKPGSVYMTTMLWAFLYSLNN
jgi:hypothetical protein